MKFIAALTTLLWLTLSSYAQNVINTEKLGFECGLPIFQDVKGIQMDEQYTITAGLRYSI